MVRRVGTNLDDEGEASQPTLEQREAEFKKALEARSDELVLAIITDEKFISWANELSNNTDLIVKS
jgi:hypothetical protein